MKLFFFLIVCELVQINLSVHKCLCNNSRQDLLRVPAADRLFIFCLCVKTHRRITAALRWSRKKKNI